MAKLAIDILHESNGRADLVEKAVKMHCACKECGGAGGNNYYPEDPCSSCGFNFADSFGVEAVVDELERRGEM